LSKLEGPGPWPFVELAESGGVRAGQWVVTLGYYRLEPEQPKEPLLKVEHVSGSAVGRWFVLNDAGKTDTLNTPAVFDLDGRLVGVGWNPYVSGDIGTVYTDAKVIRDLWKDLAAGKNLDQLRLRGIDTDAEERGRPSAALTAETEAKAKAASVHIRMSRTDRGWSGTIVTPEGLVVTCAHGLSFVLPGTQVIVCLPDGRDVNGEIVGYNHVSDVCAVRITDNGPWPHVEMGHSTRVRPGDPLLFFGYGPGDDDARQPFPRHTSAAAQWDAGWSFNLDLDPKVQLDGGDSGGGVFDADGRLVAYFLGGRAPGNPQIGRRVEVFRAHREEMTGPFQRADAGSWSTERYGSVAMPPLRN
jgi:S1-C subfamily serine protease